MGAGIRPRPRGGPVMAARAFPTSAQVSIWFNIKETVQVSCGHLAWAVQPPLASAVLATRSLLFLTPAHCPQLPLMAQGHPHSCPGAEGQTVSAAGDLLQSPCVPPVLSQVPLPWKRPPLQTQPGTSPVPLHRNSLMPASSTGLAPVPVLAPLYPCCGGSSLLWKTHKSRGGSPQALSGEPPAHMVGLARVKDAEQDLECASACKELSLSFS